MTLSIERPNERPSSTRTTLHVRRIGGRLGAVIEGVQLSPDLPDEVIDRIRAVILEHKVVFFPGQGHLDDESHPDFAARLGRLTTAHPTLTGHTSRILQLASRGGQSASSWHTDVTFTDRPPAFSVLRGVTIPDYGGHTLWANTETAYERLPEPLRELADRLWAVHTNTYDYAAYSDAYRADLDEPHRRSEFTRVEYRTEHPAVRVHPETGKHSLLLGHFFERFVGLNSDESWELFKVFQARITKPENIVRWTWTPGDVAIWDNRATQHYATSDFDQPREVRRVTVAGDTPVSISGERSRVLSGDASDFANLDDLIS